MYITINGFLLTIFFPLFAQHHAAVQLESLNVSQVKKQVKETYSWEGSLKMSTSAVQLQDVLPWGDNPIHGGRTILIYDSVETDGQFMLFAIAKQYLTWNPPALSSLAVSGKSLDDSTRSQWVHNLAKGMQNRRVLWIACGSSTPLQIQSTLKRMGTKSTNPTFTDNLNSFKNYQRTSPLHVISVPEEIGSQCLCMSNTTVKNGIDVDDNLWDADKYLRDLYQRIQSWTMKWDGVDDCAPPSVLLVLDQISSLSSMVGSALALKFILALRGWMKTHCHSDITHDFQVDGLVISSSQDIDQQYFLSTIQAQKNLSVTGGGPRSEWIGAGGCVDLGRFADEVDRWTHWDEDRARYFLQGANEAWERSLVELADGIIDVIPLSSGYSRDVHGRLVFTENKCGQGWMDSPGPAQKLKRDGSHGFFSSVVNYSFGDNAIQVFRLRSTK